MVQQADGSPTPVTRQEIIDLICKKADQHGLARWEFLGGAIAESGLNPDAWRQGIWPDWSAGLFQQTVAYADEGDHSWSDVNVALIKRLYFDPEHACNVAAAKYRYWRYDPEVPALTAWVAYNSPGFYHMPERSPNVENYRHALAEARAILGVDVPTTTPAPVYDQNAPAIAQNDPWSCAPTSARWAMTAWGRHPTEQWFESTMLAEGIVSEDDGLLDASGKALAAWLTKEYGEFGFAAYNLDPVSFNDVIAVAGLQPVLLGGRAWGHWTGVRRYDQASGTLALANPSAGWMGVGQTLNRQQFAALGPFSMVVIYWGSKPAPITPTGTVTVQSGPFAGLTLEQLQGKAEGLLSATAYLGDSMHDALTALAKEAQRVRVENVGPRP